MKGVTIRDALDAIYKQFKKKVGANHPPPPPTLSPCQYRISNSNLTNKSTLLSQADDELENPVLAGFEWDKEECWTRLIVHQKKEGAPPPSTKKSKKKAAANGEA